ncbi:MAG: hypothetical protein Q9187_002253 [Circinaria calcarea]
MRLPPELRLMIFKHHLILPRDEVHVIPRETNTMEFPVTTLLAASSSIYHEALPLYYRHNTFSFDSCRPLVEFLQSVSPGRRQHLCSIRVQYHGAEQHRASVMLVGCTGLRDLHLTIDARTLSGQRRAVRSIRRSRGIDRLRAVRGLRKVTVEFADNLTIMWGLTAADDNRQKRELVVALEALKMPRP